MGRKGRARSFEGRAQDRARRAAIQRGGREGGGGVVGRAIVLRDNRAVPPGTDPRVRIIRAESVVRDGVTLGSVVDLLPGEWTAFVDGGGAKAFRSRLAAEAWIVRKACGGADSRAADESGA